MAHARREMVMTDRTERCLSLCVWAGLWVVVVAGSVSADTGPSAAPVRCDMRSANGPLVRPWRSFSPDPAYHGQWLVAGDLDGDGVAEIVTARNAGQRVTAALASRLDGTVLWRWGQAGAGKVLWEVGGHHFESADFGPIRPDRAGDEIVVDIDHLPFGKSRVWLLDSRGRLLGDLDGDRRPEVILHSAKTIHIYKSDKAAKTPAAPVGTGVNFTLY